MAGFETPDPIGTIEAIVAFSRFEAAVRQGRVRHEYGPDLSLSLEN